MADLLEFRRRVAARNSKSRHVVIDAPEDSFIGGTVAAYKLTRQIHTRLLAEGNMEGAAAAREIAERIFILGEMGPR